MTFAEQNLDAFIDLLNKQPSLFSKENFVDLEKLINNTTDDVEQLSSAIADWYQRHPQILNTQLALLSKYSPFNERCPGSSKLNPNIPKYQKDKKSILNAIQQNLESRKEDDNKENKS